MARPKSASKLMFLGAAELQKKVIELSAQLEAEKAARVKTEEELRTAFPLSDVLQKEKERADKLQAALDEEKAERVKDKKELEEWSKAYFAILNHAKEQKQLAGKLQAALDGMEPAGYTSGTTKTEDGVMYRQAWIINGKCFERLYRKPEVK